MILSGIVLYNPDIERLTQNILAILPQVDCLLVVDNGSDNIDDVIPILPEAVVIVRNENNLGIATALNQILQYALDYGYDWALTLDQDTIVADNLIKVYKETLDGKDEVGMIHCKVVDRNANLRRDNDVEQQDGYIAKCLTSASMLRVRAWQEVGGFDDAMFIDSVDFDMCNALRDNAWKIFRTYKTEILHELGHSRVVYIFGKECLSYNYPPFRYYYIARNELYMGRKYGGLPGQFRVIVRLLLTVTMFESSKWKKVWAIMKGAVSGLFCPVTKACKRTVSVNGLADDTESAPDR